MYYVFDQEVQKYDANPFRRRGHAIPLKLGLVVFERGNIVPDEFHHGEIRRIWWPRHQHHLTILLLKPL